MRELRLALSITRIANSSIRPFDGKRSFAQGDRILLLENKHGAGIKNGMLGTCKPSRQRNTSAARQIFRWTKRCPPPVQRSYHLGFSRSNGLRLMPTYFSDFIVQSIIHQNIAL